MLMMEPPPLHIMVERIGTSHEARREMLEWLERNPSRTVADKLSTLRQIARDFRPMPADDRFDGSVTDQISGTFLQRVLLHLTT